MTRIVGTNLTWPYYIQFKSNYKYFSINKQINVITNVMKTKKKNFVFALLKLISKFYSDTPKLPLILKNVFLLTLKNCFCDYQHEIMNYYQQ